MRVFLDTNVVVSAVATRGICDDILQLTLSEHELVLSEQVIAELRKALRKKFRVEVAVVDELESFLRREAEVVSGAPTLDIEVRDADDAAIVAQAVAGNADVLVSGDQDLTELTAPPLPILTPRGFWNLLRTPGELG